MDETIAPQEARPGGTRPCAGASPRPGARKRIARLGPAILALAILPACGNPPAGGRPGDARPGGGRGAPAASTAPAGPPAVLERVGDIAIVPLTAPGFDDLAPAERAMAYYMVRAAIAGRDIAFDRGGAANLEIRDMLEEILTHPRSLDPPFREALLRYLKLFWIHNGNRDPARGRAIVPEFSFEELRAGARAAQLEGAEIRLAIGESLGGKLERLRPAIWSPGPADEGACAAGAPGTAAPGSATGTAPGGAAGAQRTMKGFLAKAAAFATGPERARILLLAEAGLDVSPAASRAWLDGWLRLDPRVDMLAGAVTTCAAAHGRDAAWRGVVWMRDDALARRLAALAPEEAGASAVAAVVLSAAGAIGPIVPSNVFVPEAPAGDGSGHRSLVLANAIAAGDRALLDPVIDLFAPPEDVALLRERGRDASFLLAALHALVGHGAGPGRAAAAAPAPTVGAAPPRSGARPVAIPGEVRAVLEETRADLRALEALFDPPVGSRAPAIAPAEAEAALRLYLVRALAGLRAVPEDGLLRGDEARAAHLITGWLVEGGHGVVRERCDGGTCLRLTDLAGARRGLGALLADVDRLLEAGDGRAAGTLVARLGTRIEPDLRDEIDGRATRAGIPSGFACAMPDLIPVRDEAGEVIDARLGSPADFTLQMLRYSGKLPYEPAAR